MSLRGIARVLKVSPGQVLSFFEAEAEELPEDLNFESTRAGPIVLYAVDIACDELWSFVRRKTNKPWVWFAWDADTRQIVAFHVGGRSEAGARALWNALPRWLPDSGHLLHGPVGGLRPGHPCPPTCSQRQGSGFAS